MHKYIARAHRAVEALCTLAGNIPAGIQRDASPTRYLGLIDFPPRVPVREYILFFFSPSSQTRLRWIAPARNIPTANDRQPHVTPYPGSLPSHCFIFMKVHMHTHTR